MRYIWQHINNIITDYNGGIPLAHYLKNYFRQYGKLGSRDRKMLSEMAYSWYRCSKAMEGNELSFETKMATCLLLCSSEVQPTTRLLPEAWQHVVTQPIATRIEMLQTEQIAFDIEKLLPNDILLSEGINKDAWLYSMLEQPRLFIRIRKQRKLIERLLKEQDINYTFINEHCLSLPNGAAIDKLLPADSYVVQDASSQATGAYFKPQPNEQWYDCCSGAGGKSLLLKDTEPNVRLTVSDSRESIIHNLKQRFRQYHHTMPNSFILDVSDYKQLEQLGSITFDNVICDVPCSGSGTWARTPEQLYFFEPEFINSISKLQQQIAVNAASKLKDGGRLIYITCSVFARENEKVVEQIVAQTGLNIQEKNIINGIAQHADSMYIAVLQKGNND